MRRLVRNPTIQYIIINLHTKYDYSSLHSFTEIFDKIFHHSKYGKKENRTNTVKNKQGEGWFAIPGYNTSLSTCLPNKTTLACSFTESLMKNFIIQSMERKKIGHIQGRGWFAIPRYSMSSSICIPNMTFLDLQGHGKIFDQKVLRNYGRTDRRNEGQM